MELIPLMNRNGGFREAQFGRMKVTWTEPRMKTVIDNSDKNGSSDNRQVSLDTHISEIDTDDRLDSNISSIASEEEINATKNQEILEHLKPEISQVGEPKIIDLIIKKYLKLIIDFKRNQNFGDCSRHKEQGTQNRQAIPKNVGSRFLTQPEDYENSESDDEFKNNDYHPINNTYVELTHNKVEAFRSLMDQKSNNQVFYNVFRRLKYLHIRLELLVRVPKFQVAYCQIQLTRST